MKKKIFAFVICLVIIFAGVTTAAILLNSKVEWVDIEGQQLFANLNVDGQNIEKIKLEENSINNLEISINDEECCGWFFDKGLTKSIDYNQGVVKQYIKKVNSKIEKGNDTITIYTRRATPDKLIFTLDSETDSYEVKERAVQHTDVEEIVVVPRKYEGKFVSKIYEVPENECNEYKGAFYNTAGFVKAIYLPASITRISNNAFYHTSSRADHVIDINLCDSLKSIGYQGFCHISIHGKVVIPDSVTSIGARAFYFSDIGEVVLPKNLTMIQERTFGQCSNLKKVTIGESVWSIGSYAFYDCGLTNVVIPNSVTNIDMGCFDDCSNLVSVTFGSGLSEIKSSVFSGCEKLRELVLPENVTSIKGFAFFKCKGFRKIYLPKTVTDLSSAAFSGCENVTSVVVENGNPVYDSRNNCNAIVETETNILKYACKTTKIPSSIKEIASYAYDYNDSITSVEISEGVEKLNDSSFRECKNLKKITLPSTLRDLKWDSFANVENLEEILVAQNNPIYNSGNGANAVIETATNTLVLGCKNTIIPDNVENIAENAFCGAGTYALEIPSSVKNIDFRAFGYMKSLAYIYLPSTIENTSSAIYRTLFYSCTTKTVIYTDIASEGEVPSGWNEGWNLYSWNSSSTKEQLQVVYGVSREQFREYIQYGQNNPDFEFAGTTLSKYIGTKKEVVIPNFVDKIGRRAFYNNRAVTKVTIPEDVEEIGNMAFYACMSLSSINLPSSIKKINEEAFLGTAISSITFPNGLLEIGRRAFANCKNLTQLYIPASVQLIDKSVFESCNGLLKINVDEANVYYDSRENCNCIIDSATNTIITGCDNSFIPEGIKKIGEDAFLNVVNLKDVVFPDGLLVIGNYAFYGCDALTDIIIPSSVVLIDSYSLCDCDNLKTITILGSLKSIGSRAFYGCKSLTTINFVGSEDEWNAIRGVEEAEIPENVTIVFNYSAN